MNLAPLGIRERDEASQLRDLACSGNGSWELACNRGSLTLHRTSFLMTEACPVLLGKRARLGPRFS